LITFIGSSILSPRHSNKGHNSSLRWRAMTSLMHSSKALVKTPKEPGGAVIPFEESVTACARGRGSDNVCSEVEKS
jgi:hypothetical protein